VLLKAQFPVKIVAERLGHADPAFTMRIYQHVLPGMQAEAAESFAALLREADQGRRGPEGWHRGQPIAPRPLSIAGGVSGDTCSVLV
jgi:hypothetical protein